MDLGNVFGYAADATGFGEQFQMAEQLFDTAAPLFELAGAAAPFVGLVCPPAGAACAMAATGAQVAQQMGIGNADEKRQQSDKSRDPTQLMAKSEEVAPRSVEHRETSGRERNEAVSERHREPPVRDHRTERDVRDHRTGGDERLKVQPGDSFLLILAKAFADDIKQKQDEIETDATNAKDSADNSLVAAKTQEFAQLVQLTNTVIQTVGGAEKTAAGQPA